MAELHHDRRALRLALALSGRDASSGRLLASAGLEYLDERDREWWPLVRLPVVYLEAAAAERLAAGLAGFVRGEAPGFAWRPEEDPVLGLQVAAAEDGDTVEIGLDLGAFLAEAAGLPRRPESELALFRFRAERAELVRFADAFGRELEALGR